MPSPARSPQAPLPQDRHAPLWLALPPGWLPAAEVALQGYPGPWQCVAPAQPLTMAEQPPAAIVSGEPELDAAVLPRITGWRVVAGERPLVWLVADPPAEAMVSAARAAGADLVLPVTSLVPGLLTVLLPQLARTVAETPAPVLPGLADAVLAHSHEAVLCTDLEGVIRYVNPALERLSGYAAHEMLGRRPSLLRSGVHEPDYYRQLWAHLTAGQTWHGRLVNRRKDGHCYHVQATLAPLRAASGVAVGYVGLQRDVSREVELADQLGQAQKMEALGRLAGGVAHDFNNLLTIIIGNTEIILSRLPAEAPQHAQATQIQRAGQRAASLTRQLLAFSRKQLVQPRRLDLNRLVADFAQMLPRLIGEDIRLVTRLAPGTLRVTADPGQLEQVIMNLAVNARDAMPEGGQLTLATSLVTALPDAADPLAAPPTGPHACLAIQDTGCGMTQEVLEQIFEPFFTTKPSGKGTGLGLATVYGIVKQAGGHLTTESAPGQGTTFRLYLPYAGDRTAGDTAELPAATPSQGRETILLVEDDPGVREMSAEMLALHGYQVLAADSGAAALAILATHAAPIALLLTDVVMPGMGGIDLAREAQRRRPGLRLLFMSGYLDRAGRHAAAAGQAFIQKPFTPAELGRSVRTVLDGPVALAAP
jgi:PAS domain S-box-containing protein